MNNATYFINSFKELETVKTHLFSRVEITYTRNEVAHKLFTLEEVNNRNIEELVLMLKHWSKTYSNLYNEDNTHIFITFKSSSFKYSDVTMIKLI